jgi:hypothetical protein
MLYYTALYYLMKESALFVSTSGILLPKYRNLWATVRVIPGRQRQVRTVTQSSIALIIIGVKFEA